MIVEKAVNMAKLMNIPILGAVENMSYVECPNCSEKIRIFGESRLDETAAREGIRALGKLPMRTDIATAEMLRALTHPNGSETHLRLSALCRKKIHKILTQKFSGMV